MSWYHNRAGDTAPLIGGEAPGRQRALHSTVTDNARACPHGTRPTAGRRECV